MPCDHGVMSSLLSSCGASVRLAAIAAIVAVTGACAESPQRPESAEPPPASVIAEIDDADGSVGEEPEDASVDEPLAMIDDEVAAEIEAGIDDAEPEAVLIPGLDSEDRFCRAWSRFTGTFQVLSVPAAFGLIDDAELLRRELVSAGITVQSGDELIDAVAELVESELSVVAESLVGPYAARATDALDALAGAGASRDDLEALDAAWLGALESYDWAELELELTLGDDRADLVERAAQRFGAQRPGWFEDTALDVEEFSIPLTIDYATANCPDEGVLAGVDAVD